MKKLNGLTALISAVLFLSSVSLVACKPTPTGKSDPIATVTDITVTGDTVYTVGDTITAEDFLVKAVMSDNTKKTISSEDVTVTVPAANLDSDGKLARSEGSEGTSEEATVKVSYDKFSKDIVITIKDVEDPAPDPDPEDPEETVYDISFSAAENTSSYSEGVYTITLNAVQAANGNWGNQIFIKNPNTAANLSAGDTVIAKITAEADKEISSLFVKDQFNGGNYTGIDAEKNIPANTPVDFVLVGTVTPDYDASSSFVLDVRGNEAGTILKLSNISAAKLEAYDVESVTISANTETPAAGETVTFTAKDQYGVVISEGVTYEITSEGVASTLEGAVLTTGAVAETVKVKAKYGEIESNEVTITVSAGKDYNKYWKPGIETEGGNAPKGYFSVWYDQWWCGSNVTLSNMSATETGCTLTRAVEGSCWFGTQIWYGLEALSDVSFKLTSSVAGKVTVNGVEYELEANVAKAVTIEGLTGRVGVQLGSESEGTHLGVGTFTISDLVVTAK